MTAQARVWRVVQRYVALRRGVARRASPQNGVDVNGKPLQCRATTRRGHRRASACRCPTTATARRTSTSPRPRSSSPRAGDRRVGRTRMVHGDRVASGAACCSGVDVGGTFTDAVLVDGGRLITAKAPTTPDDQSRRRARRRCEAALRARRPRGGRRRGVRARHDGRDQRAAGGRRRAHRARARPRASPTSSSSGARRAPELYRLCADAPGAAGAAASGASPVPERIGPDGVAARARRRRGRGAWPTRSPRSTPEAVAVCLLHAYRHPEHERRLGAALRERLGDDVHVSLSHEVAATFREFERAATTEVDAALSPAAAPLPAPPGRPRRRGRPARAARSCSPAAGWPTPSSAAGHAALTVLSGPAGGAAAAALLAARLRRAATCCASTWAARRATSASSRAARVREAAGREIGGRPLALPMVDIHTVGAGGGSIAWRDAGGALRVGPRSAGAEPGTRLLRPRRHRADGHRRQPRPRPPRPATRRWPAASRSTREAAQRRGRRAGRRARPAPTRAPAPRASSASPTPRWCARCAW